jgi:hypothetical protein
LYSSKSGHFLGLATGLGRIFPPLGLLKINFLILRGLIATIKTSEICRLQAAKINILIAAIGRKRQDLKKRIIWKGILDSIMPRSNKLQRNLETTHRKEKANKVKLSL